MPIKNTVCFSGLGGFWIAAYHTNITHYISDALKSSELWSSDDELPPFRTSRLILKPSKVQAQLTITSVLAPATVMMRSAALTFISS